MVMEEEQSHMELASESVPVPQVVNSEAQNDVDDNQVKTSRKKPRLRKKALYAAILKQMEFYFGDANLSKDRFLGNLIHQDPYVDIDVFLRFNKIRVLTNDTRHIVKALQKSTMLSLSEDGTKVCRVTPITRKENIEECTIYVQRIPLDADHEWLTTVFSQYGPVSYISIPRYKSNKKMKGFAFVEYEEPASAEKCLSAFGEKNGVLPSQTSPDELLSITTFQEEEMMEKGHGNRSRNIVKNVDSTLHTQESMANIDEVEMDKECTETQISKKRKHSNDGLSEVNTNKVDVCSGSPIEKNDAKTDKIETDDDDEAENERSEKHCGKRARLENSDRKDHKLKVGTSDLEKKLKIEKHNDESETAERKMLSESIAGPKADNKTEGNKDTDRQDQRENIPRIVEDKEVVGEVEEGKKRKRKRHHRGEKLDTADIGMEIMAKRDWKILRNKYLELQRNKMKLLKTHLKRARWNQWNSYEKIRETDKAKASQDDTKEISAEKDDKSGPRFVFTPGVIVKVEMDEPCTDPKNFKMELKRNTNIKYIDISEGATEAFIRCDTNEAAKALVLQSNEERSLSILDGDEETGYWDKMSKDREEKMSKKIRVKQRGRDKLLKKAEKELGKHIKFDEV